MANVLIIDDSIVDRQIVANTVESMGHGYSEAADGEEGELKAGTANPDLIILDVIMPKKNGFEVCRSLKTNQSTSKIPIIMLTSKTQDSDKFWGMKQGAEEYITKPFNEEDLKRLINKYI